MNTTSFIPKFRLWSLDDHGAADCITFCRRSRTIQWGPLSLQCYCFIGKSIQKYSRRGKLVLTSSGVHYVITGYKPYGVIEFLYPTIHDCTYSTSFSYTNKLTVSRCCPCFSDAFVNIAATIEGLLSRSFSSRACTEFVSLILPLDFSQERVEVAIVKKILIVKTYQNLYCDSGKLLVTEKGVFFYVCAHLNHPTDSSVYLGYSGLTLWWICVGQIFEFLCFHILKARVISINENSYLYFIFVDFFVIT